MKSLALLVLVVAACSGDDSSDEGAVCEGALYEPCTAPGDCESGMCQDFEQDGFQVCTQACTAGDDTTCPTDGVASASCNNRGICKPAAAAVCE